MIESSIPAIARRLAAVFVGTMATAAAAESPRPVFVENRGQWAEPIRYLSRQPGLAIAVCDDALLLDHRSPDGTRAAVVRLGLPSAGSVAGLGAPESGRVHVLIGEDPGRHRRDLRHYRELRVDGFAHGLALELHRRSGRPAIDFVVAPGASLDGLRFDVSGAAIDVDARGALVLVTAAGDLRLSPPVTYGAGPEGSRVAIDSRFVLHGGRSFGVEVPGRDTSQALLVDPVLEWTSYVGGTAWESAYAVAIAPGGDVVVAGQTGSSNFPTTPGAYDPTYNGFAFSDVFVSRFAADGTSFVFSTFLGGTQGEEARSVSVDDDGRVAVAGTTASSGFPTTAGAMKTSVSSSSDAFVSVLTADGASLVYSTLLGGGSGDLAESLTWTPSGTLIVTGTTSSTSFPTTPGVADTALSGTSDAFLAEIDPAGGALLFSTFLGGSDGDVGEWVAITDAGIVVVGGTSSSANFPLGAGGFDTQHDGSSDAFLVVVATDGSTVQHGTFLGGSAGDTGEAVAVVGDDVVVAGVTSSGDFPTTPQAYDQSPDGTSDGWVARVDATASTLAFATLIGGSSGDVLKGVGVDAAERVFVGGVTSSGDYPVTADAFNGTPGGSSDGFLSQLDPSGSSLLFSTFVGGSKGDVGEAMAASPAGDAVLVGTTSSNDLAVTPGVPDPIASGSSESFASLLSFCPGTSSGYGVGCAGSGGFIPGFSIDGCPVAGSTVTLSIDSGLGGSSALVLIGLAPASVPMGGGCLLLVQPVLPIALTLPLPGVGPGGGAIAVPVAIPADAPPAVLTLQAFVVDGGVPLGFSNSNGVELSIP